jgi:hypothetical protein
MTTARDAKKATTTRNDPFALPQNGKHPVTLQPANHLFSHPETHDAFETSGSPDPEQPSWTNLFQEPVPTQRASAER